MAKMGLQSNTILSTKLSILIIGPQIFHETLSSVLKTQVENQFKVSASIHNCELVKDVSERTDYSFFDSIIMVVDTTRDNFSNEMVEALSGISSQHLSTRLFLVNGCSGSCNFISNIEFKRIADRFNINYLSAEIKDPESCAHLVDRLVPLINLTTGITTGRPMTIPTAKVLSNISQQYYEKFAYTTEDASISSHSETH